MSDDNTNESTTTGYAEERAQATGAGAAAAMQQQATSDTFVETKEGVSNYAAAGEVFTNWFNRRVGELPSPTVKLGAKTAEVVRLHEDGRLECEVEGEGSKNEQVFVTFEAGYLDQLLRKITALGL